jgi:hypothetical protein
VDGVARRVVHRNGEAIELQPEPMTLSFEALHPAAGHVAREYAPGWNQDSPVGTRDRSDDQRTHEWMRVMVGAHTIEEPYVQRVAGIELLRRERERRD